MKKIVFISAIALSSLFYKDANAQVRLSFGFHFGPRRVYVPERVVVQDQPVVQYTEPAEYDGDEDYYYLPDLDAYYSVTEQCYYYNEGNRWISAAYLPGGFHDFDWRYARHYEVRAPRPYIHNDYYRSRYNGVAFNGRWDHFDNNRYYHGYAGAGRNNYDHYSRNEQHFDRNRQQGRGYDQNPNRASWGRPANNDRNWNRQPSNNNNGYNNNDNHFTRDDHFARNSRPVVYPNSHRPGRF